MKKIFSIFAGLSLFFWTAHINAASNFVNKLNGTWDGGLFVMTLDMPSKTMISKFGNEEKKSTFSITSENDDSITIVDANNSEIIIKLGDDNTLLFLEKSTGKPWAFKRVSDTPVANNTPGNQNNETKTKSVFNPDNLVVSGSDLYKEFEKNKFAFRKNYTDKKMTVLGTINEVGESNYDMSKIDSKSLPVIKLKGLFSAFIPENSSIDLANLQENDSFSGVCEDIKEGFGGLYVQGLCEPTLILRKTDNGLAPIFITDNKKLLEFSFTPEYIKILESTQK